MSLTCEVVAVGSELLLGQSVDTNSTWIGERLAGSGIDSHFHTKVGDNRGRIVSVLRTALARSDAVVVCGGLGPTHDDLTREAIAEVMGVELRTDPEVADRIRALFQARGRPMPESNLRQARVPVGAAVISQRRGTAPGLVCPVGDQVVYAVPGVPHEMREMVERAVLPDLRRRSGETAVIVSRVLRTWGDSESGLADRLHSIIDRLDAVPGVTLAFLASGIEGLKVRLTVKSPDRETARVRLAEEEDQVRAVLGAQVFGTDDETMEDVVLGLLVSRGLTLGIADAVTGGIVSERLEGRRSRITGSGPILRGALVTSDAEVTAKLFAVPAGAVATRKVAVRLAEGAGRMLGSDVGLGIVRPVRPGAEDDPPGAVNSRDEAGAVRPSVTVFLGLSLDGKGDSAEIRLPGDPELLRKFACISALNFLRLALVR